MSLQCGIRKRHENDWGDVTTPSQHNTVSSHGCVRVEETLRTAAVGEQRPRTMRTERACRSAPYSRGKRESEHKAHLPNGAHARHQRVHSEKEWGGVKEKCVTEMSRHRKMVGECTSNACGMRMTSWCLWRGRQGRAHASCAPVMQDKRVLRACLALVMHLSLAWRLTTLGSNVAHSLPCPTGSSTVSPPGGRRRRERRSEGRSRRHRST